MFIYHSWGLMSKSVSTVVAMSPLRRLLRSVGHELLRRLAEKDVLPAQETDVILAPPWEIVVSVSSAEQWPEGHGAVDVGELRRRVAAVFSTANAGEGLRDVEEALLAAAGPEPVPGKAIARKAGYRWNSYTRAALAELVRSGRLLRTPDGVQRVSGS